MTNPFASFIKFIINFFLIFNNAVYVIVFYFPVHKVNCQWAEFQQLLLYVDIMANLIHVLKPFILS